MALRGQINGAENAVGAWVTAPVVEKRETLHFILRLTDKGVRRCHATSGSLSL